MYIDLKDRKILYQLDLNCRQSNAQIGKKVGLSRKVVDYRIKRMEDAGIIRYYWTAIDTFILGYQVFRIYLKFQNITLKIKNDLINYFVNYKNSWAVITPKTPVDFVAIIWVNSVSEFYHLWNKIVEKYDDYFSFKNISNIVQVVAFDKSYLLSEKDENIERPSLYEIKIADEIVKLDRIDYEILNELAIDARIPLIDLAKKLNCSSQNTKYRIDNLIKKGIIKAFRVYLNYSKIGLHFFSIDVYLKKHDQKNKIISYFKRKTCLEYYQNDIGWADIGFQVVLKNTDTLLELIDEFNDNFSDSIKKHEFWISEEFHKERWLPEMEFK